MGKRRKKPFVRRRTEPEHRINDRIRAREVRIVGMEDEKMDGVYPLQGALDLARDMELDLVEIAAKADPPVCRVVEYSKFRYEQKKRKKENKSKQHTVVMKEIRFGPNTDQHDFDFKLRHAQKFLEEGNKIRAYVHFRGRSILYKDRGRELLTRFVKELDELGKLESNAKMEGKRMVVVIAPRK